MTAKLVLDNIGKVYDSRWVVKDFSLRVSEGEFVALLGPSGCGKSTILAMIVGFERPDSGTVTITGRSVDDLPPQRRNLGLVMQDYAVFSRMTVRQNLEFGLKMRCASQLERRATVAEFAERFALDKLLDRKGDTLNLSEMQRVALARTLVTKPSLLLLDEPISNLDASVRSRLRSELKLIQQEFGQTVLYVTHDQIEAMSMADRIAVMREGAIEQVGTPIEVYRRPRNRYVAQFLGEPPINLLECKIEQRFGEQVACTPPCGTLPLPQGIAFEGATILAVRPHRVAVLHEGRLQQVDRPERLYDMPINRFVAEFIGAPPMNLIPARLRAENGGIRLVGSGFALDAPNGLTATAADKELWIGVRPEAVHVEIQPTMEAPFAVRIRWIEHHGSRSIVHADLGGTIIKAAVPPDFTIPVDSLAWLGFAPRLASLFGRVD